MVSVQAICAVLEVSIFVTVFLFGILTLQVYYYFLHHDGDGPYVKAMAGTVWLLELIRTILLIHFNYYITIANPIVINTKAMPSQNPESILTWSVVVILGICAFLDTIFQVYYALRLKMLVRRWELPVLCWFLCFAEFVLVLAVLSLAGVQPQSFFTKYHSLLIAIAACRVPLDLLTAFFLVYYLPKSERQRLGARKYILLLLESGAITSILGVLLLAALLWDARTPLWLAVCFILGQGQMNCLLTGLNTRHLWSSGLPLVDVGKTPNFLAFKKPSKATEINFAIQVEKSESSSNAPSMNDDIEHSPLPSK